MGKSYGLGFVQKTRQIAAREVSLKRSGEWLIAILKWERAFVVFG